MLVSYIVLKIYFTILFLILTIITQSNCHKKFVEIEIYKKKKKIELKISLIIGFYFITRRLQIKNQYKTFKWDSFFNSSCVLVFGSHGSCFAIHTNKSF